MQETAPRARNVAIWGVLDQVMTSGSNFVFIVLVARALAPVDFGAVALGFELYLMAVIGARGVAGDVLASAYPGRAADEVRHGIRSAAGTAVSVGLLVALGTAVAALWLGPTLRSVLWVVAVALPLLVLQDLVRQALIVQGRARTAFVNDTLWGVLQVPLLLAATELRPTPGWMVAAWAGAGAVATVVGLVQLRAGAPRPTVLPWLRRHRTLWPYFLGDNLVLAASSFVVVVAISGLTGLAGLAAFRAAMTVYAPLSTLGRGVVSVGVTLLARRRTDPAWIRRSSLLLSWLLVPTAFVWGALFVVLPDSVGRAFMGESWDGAEPLVLLASFPCAVALFTVGTGSGMRALGAGRQGFLARVGVTVIAFAAFVVGVAIDGVRGSFVVFALSSPLQVGLWWWLLEDAARRARTAMPDRDAEDPAQDAPPTSLPGPA